MYHYYTSTCACTQIWMLMNTCMYPDPPHLHMFSLIFPFLIAFWKRIYANRRQNLLLNPPLPPSSRTRITPCLLLLLIHRIWKSFCINQCPVTFVTRTCGPSRLTKLEWRGGLGGNSLALVEPCLNTYVSKKLRECIHTHTYIHTYNIHTYIHTYIHTCMNA